MARSGPHSAPGLRMDDRAHALPGTSFLDVCIGAANAELRRCVRSQMLGVSDVPPVGIGAHEKFVSAQYTHTPTRRLMICTVLCGTWYGTSMKTHHTSRRYTMVRQKMRNGPESRALAK